MPFWKDSRFTTLPRTLKFILVILVKFSNRCSDFSNTKYNNWPNDIWQHYKNASHQILLNSTKRSLPLCNFCLIFIRCIWQRSIMHKWCWVKVLCICKLVVTQGGLIFATQQNQMIPLQPLWPCSSTGQLYSWGGCCRFRGLCSS